MQLFCDSIWWDICGFLDFFSKKKNEIKLIANFYSNAKIALVGTISFNKKRIIQGEWHETEIP